MTDSLSKSDICNNMSEDLSALIDGELPKEELIKVYEHLLVCENCRQNYEDLKITQKTLKNYFEHSTKKINIPEKQTETIFLKTAPHQQISCPILNLRFPKKIIAYSTAIFLFLGSIAYLSINFININMTDNNSINKIKFVNNIQKNTEKNEKIKADKILPLIPTPAAKQ